MATTTGSTLPADFLTDATKNYATRIGGITAAPLDTSQFAPKVAPQDQYQTDAYTMAGQVLIQTLCLLISKMLLIKH